MLFKRQSIKNSTNAGAPCIDMPCVRFMISLLSSTPFFLISTPHPQTREVRDTPQPQHPPKPLARTRLGKRGAIDSFS